MLILINSKMCANLTHSAVLAIVRCAICSLATKRQFGLLRPQHKTKSWLK